MNLSSKKRSKRKVQYYSDERVLENFYEALASGDSISLKRVHIPRSEVFYTREAYYQYSGDWVSLDKMERCMYLEGMLKAEDCFEPKRKRDWES